MMSARTLPRRSPPVRPPCHDDGMALRLVTAATMEYEDPAGRARTGRHGELVNVAVREVRLTTLLRLLSALELRPDELLADLA